MDVQLIEKAPEFITFVTEAIKNYGSNDVCIDPIYCLFGYPSQNYVDAKIRDFKAEIDAVIDFASCWDIDPTEWNLEADWDRFIFAVQYIAGDFDEYDLQQNGETLEHYCDSILAWIHPAEPAETVEKAA